MSVEQKCCYIGTIIPNYHYSYNTNVLNNIKKIIDFEKYILANYPIYLEDNLLLKNIDNDIKNHIWIKIKYLDNFESFTKSIKEFSEKFLPKKKKFTIIYDAYKTASKNNTTIDEELRKFYDNVDHYYVRDLIYYMTLSQYILS